MNREVQITRYTLVVMMYIACQGDREYEQWGTNNKLSTSGNDAHCIAQQ